MSQVQANTNNEAGFVSIEILGGLAVLTIVLSVVYSLWSTELVEMQKRAVAKHFEMVSNAAEEYAEEKKADLLAASDTLNLINNNAFWPDTLNTRNTWQQEYVVYSRKNSDDKLELIILTTGGRTHDDDEPKFGHVVVPSTAAITPIGFIPIGAVNKLRGAYNDWEETLPTGSNGIPAMHRKAGHLGNVIIIADDSSSGDSGSGDGEGGTVTPPVVDLTGKVDTVQFVNKTEAQMKDACDGPDDLGKIFFMSKSKDDWDEKYNSIFICGRDDDGKIRVRWIKSEDAEFDK